MKGSLAVLMLFACVFLMSLIANLIIGASAIHWQDVIGALFLFDPDSYDHFVVLYQRLPRALIAILAGSVLACGGLVLQGITRNPLASPSTLGINAGATLFVVAGAYSFDLGVKAQGAAALVGGTFGFLSCFVVARLAGLSRSPHSLALILSGALVSMLFIGLANAILLSDPARRTEFLGWITGNINHVYAERLYDFWWIGALALLCLLMSARPLTLITLGQEKAASAGVNVVWVSRIALVAVMLGSASAVAICGPVGFVGLVVPHIVRPLIGSRFEVSLPASAMMGASVCLLADLVARKAFDPYVLHTGLIMDLMGGLVFALIVKRYYLKSSSGREA
ncbi:FecCD family ABC transporter permease [Roseibium algae]|uniref:Iron ABC transporter permease n=1 Tax=Roseibium algae TaxID=3123038 RepID=A0ABU8THX5_9HYPH